MRLFVFSFLAAAGLTSASCASAPPAGNVAGDYLAGRLAARVNALDDAARVYGEAHRAAPDEVALLKDAFFYQIAAGNIEEALPYARALLARSPKDDDGLARLTVGASEMKLGRWAEARTALKGDISAPFMKSLAFLSDVWIEKEIAGADAALVKLAEPPAEVFGGFNQLHEAFLADGAGRPAQARAAFESAVAGLGGPIARRAYGAFLERAGDAAKARDYYAIFAAESAAGRRGAARAADRLERNAPSTEFSSVSAGEGAAAAFYAFAQAMIEEAADQRQRADLAGFNVGEPRFNFPLVLARLAIYLDPGLDEARRLAGDILNVYGDIDAAAEALGPIPAASPHFEAARISMAAGLTERERTREAERLLKDAIRRDPDGASLQWTLATLYERLGDHERSVGVLNRVIAAQGEPPQADTWRFFVSRGAALIELDRWDEAEADLKRAVALAPEEPAALNYLGYSWAEKGLHLDEAFALIQRAIDKQPQSGAIIDSLGWAQFQLGRHREAVVNLERAAALEPSDPTITDHLGDVYWRLGRDLEARYQWRRALELDPLEAHRQAVLKKIAEGLPPETKAADGGE